MDDHGSETTSPSDDSNVSASKLNVASKSAVDQLFEHGMRNAEGEASTDGEDASRKESLRGLLGLLDHYPVESATDELLDATLARVDRHEADQSARMQVSDQQDAIVRSRWRFPDLMASAAALLLAVGIGWPVWQSIQNNRVRGTSEARLNSIGTAIAGFSGDNAGFLPLDQGLMNQTFDPVKNPHSTHLLNTLPRGDYLAQNQLFLHSNPAPNSATSFSYRVPTNVRQFRLVLMRPNTPVAGDRNPILWHLRAGHVDFKRFESSPTHQGRGQVVLQGDLATRWDSVPIHGNDPIWTSQGCTKSEVPLCTPEHPQDTVLAD